jgi:hypothetical protein
MSGGRSTAQVLLWVLSAAVVSIAVLAVAHGYPAFVVAVLIAMCILHVAVTVRLLQETSKSDVTSLSTPLRGAVYALYFGWALVAIPLTVILATSGDNPEWGQMLLGIPLATPAAVQWLMRRRHNSRPSAQK